MNSTKLGLRFTSSVLASALALAPVHGALAAPPEDETAPADGEASDAPAEGAEAEAPADGAEGDAAEGAEGAEAEAPADGAEGDAPAEGVEDETQVDGAEGDAAEGAEGAPVESDPAEGDAPAEGQGEAEEAEEAEAPPPELEADVPMRPPEPTWGPKDQYPMTGKGMLITGGVVTGLGAAFIVTSVIITNCDFDSSIRCKYGDQRDFLVPTAVATTGLGLLLLGVGVGNHVKYKKWERWEPEKTAVVPTFMPGGGGGVAMVGRF